MPKNVWLSAVALSAALIMGASTIAISQDKTDKPGMRGSRYPHLHAAERALQHAGNQLEKAAHHFGGHRAKALGLVKQAEQELREAVAWADAHPEELKKSSQKQ